MPNTSGSCTCVFCNSFPSFPFIILKRNYYVGFYDSTATSIKEQSLPFLTTYLLLCWSLAPSEPEKFLRFMDTSVQCSFHFVAQIFTHFGSSLFSFILDFFQSPSLWSFSLSISLFSICVLYSLIDWFKPSISLLEQREFSLWINDVFLQCISSYIVLQY